MDSQRRTFPPKLMNPTEMVQISSKNEMKLLSFLYINLKDNDVLELAL